MLFYFLIISLKCPPHFEFIFFVPFLCAVGWLLFNYFTSILGAQYQNKRIIVPKKQVCSPLVEEGRLFF